MPTLCVRFVIAEGMPMARMLPTSRAVTARRRRAVDDGPRVDGQVAAVTQREPDEIGVGADVGDHGGTGRTRSTPAESVDEQGLSTMLTAVPATEPIMDCTAWPSVRSRLDGVIDTMMNGEPTMISV